MKAYEPPGGLADGVEALFLLGELPAGGRPHVRVGQVALERLWQRRVARGAPRGARVVLLVARPQPLLLLDDLVLERIRLDGLEVTLVRAVVESVRVVGVWVQPHLAVERPLLGVARVDREGEDVPVLRDVGIGAHLIGDQRAGVCEPQREDVGGLGLH